MRVKGSGNLPARTGAEQESHEESSVAFAATIQIRMAAEEQDGA